MTYKNRGDKVAEIITNVSGALAWDGCAHKATELRLRNRASNWHVARQCLECGQQVGSFVKKDVAAKEAGTVAFPEFDEGLADRIWQNWQRVNEGTRAELREERRAQYHDYLRTPQWREKSRRVRERARGMCEGCGERRCTQVHHLTYDHIGAEFLWELVAVCDECHERAHDKDNNADRG